MSWNTLLALVCALLVLPLVVLVIVWLRRRLFTRERFAFYGLSAVVSFASLGLLSLKVGPPWDLIGSVAGHLLGFEYRTQLTTDASDYLLLFVLSILVAQVVVRLHANWDGAVSFEQRHRERHHEPSGLLVEAGLELRRFVMGRPVIIFTQTNTVASHGPIEWPNDTLAWHLQARDLITLRSPSLAFDRQTDWHDKEAAWIGRNKRTNGIVAMLCAQSPPGQEEFERFEHYVKQFTSNHGLDVPRPELIVAIREIPPDFSRDAYGTHVQVDCEDSLLDDLVDFSDYDTAMRRRVEQDALPDSSLTLDKTYVHSRIRGQAENEPNDLDAFLKEWINESGQRHLALLAEYGQGKSTAALMFTYALLTDPFTYRRKPLLIELRGKSPRNMTPEELLASWALPYDINPRALDKLLRAGRLVLILEGFDEMALVGDPELRLNHFRTIWKLAYPKNKVLITGRPNFFLDDAEQKTSLGIDRPRGGPYCEAIHLLPFEIDQMREALRHSEPGVADEIINLAINSHHFRELVSRPSLLYLVSQLWRGKELSELKDRLDSAVILDLFVQHSYQRQSAKSAEGLTFMILTEREREYFMEGVAAYMVAKSLPNQITKDALTSVVESLYRFIPDSISSGGSALATNESMPLRRRLEHSEDAVAEICADVRACGLLVSDIGRIGAFKFAHKSFLEFLFGKIVADHLMTPNERSASLAVATGYAFADILTQPESISFLAELVAARIKTSETTGTPFVMASRLFRLVLQIPHRSLLKTMLVKRALLELSYSMNTRALLSVVATTTMGFIVMGQRYFLHELSYPTAIVQLFGVVALLLGFALAVVVGPPYSSSSVLRTRLVVWYLACRALDLKETHMRSVVSTRSLDSISKHAAALEHGLGRA